MARKAFIERGTTPAMMRKGLKFQKAIMKLSKIPVIGRRHPWVRPDKTNTRFLPINADIRMPENAPMPADLLDRLIEEASHRVIVDYCGCRKGFECKNYPEDIGCLFMGDSALDVPKSISREVGVEESRAHARRAMEAGLVPIVGRAHVDNFIFGIKDRARLLTVCFCCECCSITRFIKDVPLKYLEPAFTRLSGISIEVTDECKGCGKCAERCFIEAIEVVDKKAVIDETCRACGRCATFCPNDAIEIRIEDPDFLEDAYSRIRVHVTYS